MLKPAASAASMVYKATKESAQRSYQDKNEGIKGRAQQWKEI